MRIRNSLHFVLLSFAIGCTPYVAPLPEAQLPASRPEPVHIEVLQPQKKSNLTFIDTLNRSNEIVLSENDFSSNPIANAGNNTVKTVPYESVPHFRVQVFASSLSERLKEDKKKLEKQFLVPITISFESPLYKLYAGDFSQRTGADSLLAKIKKIGYQDAWVVSIKNNSKP